MELLCLAHPLADQLLARADQRADGVRWKRLQIHALEEACAGQTAPALAHHCDRSCGWQAT